MGWNQLANICFKKNHLSDSPEKLALVSKNTGALIRSIQADLEIKII